MAASLHPVRLLPVAAACALGGAILLAAGRDVAGALLLGMGLGAGALGLLGSRTPARVRREPSTDYVHASLVEALAGAIDAKNDPSGKRLQRRRAWATALGEAIGLPAADIEALRTAALLLDIGQLAVPDHILSKPGPLSVEEFHKIRIHPQVSAGLIEGVPLPKAVGDFVRSHHERWDGKGYPEGLAKEAIPGGCPRPGGRRQLRCAGQRAALPRPADARRGDRRPSRGGRQVARSRRSWSASSRLLPSIEGGPSLDTTTDRSLVSIVSARREDVALFEISQAITAGLGVEGTAQLLAQKLRRVIPYSSAALYLYDPSRRSFKAAFTEGVEAEMLATVRDGGRCRHVRAVAPRAARGGQRRPADLHGRPRRRRRPGSAPPSSARSTASRTTSSARWRSTT